MTPDFARSPFIVIWETTRACALRCPLGKDPGCAWQPRGAAGVPAIAGGSDAAPAVTSDRVTEALRAVLDPELGMSVVDLGLIYGIEVHGGTVSIAMTLTAPGCPIHDAMTEWVRQAVLKIPGVGEVEVALTFDPPWTPERISFAPGSRR